jgi:hypothetical protein
MRLKRPSCTIGRKSQPGKTGMLKMTLPLRYEFDAEPRGMFVLLLVRLRLDMQCTFKGDFRAGNRRPIEPLKELAFLARTQAQAPSGGPGNRRLAKLSNGLVRY